jgi:pilus assembly protein CpaC
MRAFRPRPCERRKGRSIAGLAFPLLSMICLGATGSFAQESMKQTVSAPLDGFNSRLPDAVPLPPRPSFIESLSPTASVIEVKIGQGRFLTLQEKFAAGQQNPIVAVGDPSVVDFFVTRVDQIRLIGKKLGTTDLSITTGSGKTFDYEIQVVADLDTLRAQLRQMFPDASLRIAQLREKIVVEGQARDAAQVTRIVATIDTYMRSVQGIQVLGQVNNQPITVDGPAPDNLPPLPPQPGMPGQPNPAVAQPQPGGVIPAPGAGNNGGNPGNAGGPSGLPGGGNNNLSQVISLIRVPTSQQVLLKVRVAELNRTGFRQIGADFLASIPQFGTLFGSQIAGNGYAGGALGSQTFSHIVSSVGTNQNSSSDSSSRGLNLGSQATAFGTFSHGQFNTILTALRKNNLVKILAEPNLVALNGYQANFLAGGEFPVPTFSGVGSGSTTGGGTSTTQFKKFGVQLAFLPIILDDDTVRLTVEDEVSSVDFSVATTLVPGGSPVPGLSVRNSHTTVELKQGETLAIAGLMQLTLDGETQKIPGLGDLPYIGTFFSNTSSNRVEKELIVLITPYIIEPMKPDQVPPSPGDEVEQPNDLEFFFLNRIEGRTGIDARSTTNYDDPFHLIRHSLVERKYLVGPSGYSK